MRHGKIGRFRAGLRTIHEKHPSCHSNSCFQAGVTENGASVKEYPVFSPTQRSLHFLFLPYQREMWQKQNPCGQLSSLDGSDRSSEKRTGIDSGATGRRSSRMQTSRTIEIRGFQVNIESLNDMSVTQKEMLEQMATAEASKNYHLALAPTIN